MFDPDLSDANGFLMAKSGGGKTLAAQQMLLMAARANPLISILERGDSYQPLVELMGGEMIEMSLDSDQTINPWDLPRGETKPSNDQISFLKNLTRHMLGENTPPDLDIDLLDSVLLEAIASTYKTLQRQDLEPDSALRGSGRGTGALAGPGSQSEDQCDGADGLDQAARLGR